MEKITPDNLKLLLQDFYKWYSTNEHSKREKEYTEFQNKDYWSGIENTELINVMTEFVRLGGGIQSGGERNEGRFNEYLKPKVVEFKEAVLTIFKNNFDLESWWESMNNFPGFGIGIRSIFLHRVNPQKYVICNDKSIDGFKLVGYIDKEKSNKFQRYLNAKDIIDEFIRDTNENLTYYQVDSIWEYIVGQGLGYEYLPCSKNINFFKIAPGEKGKYWDDFKKDKEIRIHYPPIPDLNTFDTKAELIDFIREHNVFSGSQVNIKSEEIWYFKNIKIGDMILANKGLGGILGRGIVSKEYFFDPDNKDNHHCLGVKWYDKTFKSRKLPDVWSFNTVIKLSKEEFFNIANGKEYIKKKEDKVKKIPSQFPLNQILFGAPGTGKTYNSINRALELINEKEEKELDWKDRSKVKLLFDKRMSEGRIIFTTFHQSMCYEDFIEGIKPQQPDVDEQFVKYSVEPGIFKQICLNAQTPNISGFETIYNQFIEDLNNLPDGELLKLKTPKNKDFYISANSRNNLNLHTGVNKRKAGAITKEGIQKELQGVSYYFWWRNYYNGVMNYLKEQYNFKPELSDNNNKNYVLIVDEINRGNVSQIFGELITLIEEDKRLGAKEALEVTLPYSKEKFGVPSNLYIIGTMNTADRSVEALDTALRRRFSFVEYQPVPELIASDGKLRDKKGVVDGIDLVAVLRIINLRIEKLLDKDHLIGHSYFMSVESLDGLKQTFQNKILPLLQEYFFGDYGKIGLVLGKGFCNLVADSDDNIFAESDDYDQSEFLQRKVYKLNNVAEMTDETFKQAITTLMKKQ